MAVFACMLILILLTAPLTLLFRARRFEELVPISLFTAILVLYFFAMFQQLRAGAIAVLVLAIAGFALFLYRVLARKDRDALHRFLSPGIAAYTALGIGAFIVTSGLVAIVDNDSFCHWALVVKNMVLFNALGNASGSTAVFQSYPPAVSLLQSWLMLLSGGYHQGLNYAGVALFSVTITAPALRATSWKRPLQMALISLLLFLCPIVIFNNNYATLQVDSLIGMLGALFLFTYFTNRKDERYTLVMLALTGTILSLTKTFGTVFLCIVGAIALCDTLFLQRKTLVAQHGVKKFTRGILFVMLGALFGVVSWAIYTRVTPITTMAQTTSGAMDGLRALLASPAEFFSGYRKDVLFQFVNEIFSATGYRFIQLSYAGWMLLLVVPWLILALKGKPEKRRSYALLAGGLLVGFFLYAGLLLFSYLTTFEPFRAVKLGSFERYVYSYFQIAFCTAFFMLMTWDGFQMSAVSLCIAACLILPVTPVRDLLSIAVQGQERLAEERPLMHTEQLYQTLDRTTTQVGYISADQAFSYWGTRYYATPVPFQYYDLDAMLLDAGSAADAELAQRMLSELVTAGCTHLYIGQSNSRIVSLITAINPDLTGSEYTLYTIDASSAGYGLTTCAFIDGE